MQSSIYLTPQKLLFILLMILALCFAAFSLNTTDLNLAALLILGLVVVVLSFIRQDMAAITIIFAMLLSPEIKLLPIGSRRDLVVRYDDIIIITFFFSWLFKMAYFKDTRLFRKSYLTGPIIFYIIVGLISTSFGYMNGEVRLVKGFFYFLKYIEYFFLFFMFSNIIQTEAQVKKFITAFFITSVLVSSYALYQASQGVIRVSTPFEGRAGEANTLGGYLVLALGISLMSFIKARKNTDRLLYLMLSVLYSVVLVITYSRASYLGFIIMALMVLYFAKPIQRGYMVLAVVIIVMLSPIIMPVRFFDRVTQPFRGHRTEVVAPMLKLNVYDSSYSKVESFRKVVEEWKDSPIIGKGITAVGLVDTQWPLILGEMGLLGVFAFMLIVWSILQAYNAAMRILRSFPDEQVWQWKAICMGYICGFFGLLAHGFGANTFIIVRIMEPFWFLTAVVAAMPNVMRNKSISMIIPETEIV